MALPLFWASTTASRLGISVLRRRIFGSGPVLLHVPAILRDLKYADTHEWVKIDGTAATIGITDHAQDHLGDVMFVELPEVGHVVKQGCSFAAVESMKATRDVNSPVSGKVIEVHEELSSSPGLVNWSPYERGWMIKVEMSDPGELNKLMDSDDYSKFCEEEGSKH